MKALRFGVLTLVVAISGIAHAQNANKRLPDRERLIGAWCLVHIESPGLDGKIIPIPQPKGMLIYTRDGHMSVQLMYPKSVSGISNQVCSEWLRRILR